MIKLVLEKAEESEIKLPTSAGSSKKLESSRKKNICFTDYSLWLCGLQQTWKFLKRWECQTTLSASWEICMQVKKQHLELAMEKQTGSKLGKEYIKAVYCCLVYLNSVQNTSCKMLDWMKHKLESRLLGEISITSDMEMTPPLWQKVKRN